MEQGRSRLRRPSVRARPCQRLVLRADIDPDDGSALNGGCGRRKVRGTDFIQSRFQLGVRKQSTHFDELPPELGYELVIALSRGQIASKQVVSGRRDLGLGWWFRHQLPEMIPQLALHGIRLVRIDSCRQGDPAMSSIGRVRAVDMIDDALVPDRRTAEAA